jgi:RNA polymerase sigma-70 factor (ECF subfamily)
MPAPAPEVLALGHTSLIHQLVDEHLDFVWRSLRRLGVREADCDDGCQRVWLIVARKLLEIAPGKERSFIFSVVLRVASEMRRRDGRHNHWDELQPATVASDGNPADPERQLEHKQAVELLDLLLTKMSFEQRTVFILFELEGFSSVEIARELGTSRGTVASRLRLAREALERALLERDELLGQRSRASGE